ncbi:MAG: 5-formyltetrahydrofolate cyclo-ligase [Rhodothermales bacterium]
MTKKALRQDLLSRRIGLSASEYERLNTAVMRRLLHLPELRTANTIHCFWPIHEKREVNTSRLIKKLYKKEKQIVLPVVLSFNNAPTSGSRMEHRMYEGETNMITNRWGVQEPAEKEPFPVSQLDLVIVPALGVTRNGFRLGYGKGFYDEFLAQCNCPFVCPIFSNGLLDTMPTMPHDIPVDIIVTEHEVIRTNT